MKNNLEFVGIVADSVQGKPYYSITFKEDGILCKGYSSYSLDVISEFLKKYFIFNKSVEAEKEEKLTYENASELYTEDEIVKMAEIVANENPSGLRDEKYYQICSRLTKLGADSNKLFAFADTDPEHAAIGALSKGNIYKAAAFLANFLTGEELSVSYCAEIQTDLKWFCLNYTPNKENDLDEENEFDELNE